MKSSFENNILTVFCEGRINADNAAEVQAQILAAIDENPTENVTVDLGALNYISSAGLRVMLKLRKMKPQLKIAQAQPAVYDVFETTGFTEMMNIEKGYRHVDLDGCEIIGEGSNGIVYRQDPETVVKVYKENNSLADIERERALARTAFIKGIPTAISFDIVKYNGHLASVFELLNAVSITKRLIADSSEAGIDENAEIFIDVLKKIHSCTDEAHLMPSHKEKSLGWVEYIKDVLPQDTYQKLYAMMQAIPESDRILHGDYHTNNVLIQSDGEPVLIDMDTLSRGAPIFEFGSVYNAYVGFSAFDHSKAKTFLDLDLEISEKFYWTALRKYFGTADEAVLDPVSDRIMLMGSIRLLRRTLKRMAGTEEGRRAAEYYRSEVIRLTEQVDDFSLPLP